LFLKELSEGATVEENECQHLMLIKIALAL